MLRNNITCESKEYPFPESYNISAEAINEFEATAKKYTSKGYTDCVVSYNGDSFGSRTYTIYLIKGSNSIQIAQYNPNSNDKLITQVSGAYVIGPSSEKILKIAYNLRYSNGEYIHVKTVWNFEEEAKYFPIAEQGKNNELEINGDITFSSLPIQNFDSFTGCCQDTLIKPALKMIKKFFVNLKDRHNPCEKPPVSSKSQKQEYFFIDKAETMKYLQGQDITISCEVDGDVELESGGVLFQYQLEGQDTYTDVKAEVTTSSTGKKRIWVRVKLP